MSMIGKTLGNFVCTALIGKGGMGEVYRAKDRRLGRDVAIKVLPEEFARDADRVARFQREAKLLASLNHPNIAAIHDLEESDGIHFLVLELVEGETLADRLKHATIPVDEALKLALQITEALESAHEKGVIHRDLKPANIKITPDGKAKVLDFGLAKAFAGDQEDMNLSNSPTLSLAATQQGVILGTAAYMSPEQAKGRSVDKKADIWSFGCVLYEILTGKAAFQGEDVTEILASVVKASVNLDLLPANLHPKIREVIFRCLQKEQKRRYSGIGDARYEIEQVLTDPSGVFAPPASIAEPQSRLRTTVPWAIAVLAFVLAAVAFWNLRTPEPPQITRFSHELQDGRKFSNLRNIVLSVSPDGKNVVYATTDGLFRRSVDELDARLIPGTDEMPSDPFFSPDGQWIGYFSGASGQLKKIAIGGGAPVMLSSSANANGSSWSKDNFIFYSAKEGILRISENGGTPELLVEPTGIYAVDPQMLPDGKTLLFTLLTGRGGEVMIQSLESGERRMLFSGDTAQYLPTGHLIYSLGSDLIAVPFDLDNLEIVGGQVPIVEGVFRVGPSNPPQYAISDSGTLAYIPGALSLDASSYTLVWVDREGREEPLAAQPKAYGAPRISPDGTRVALSIVNGGNPDIWIWDLDRETLTRLTFDEADDSAPLWTPDGQRIVFSSNRDGNYGIFRKAADGTGEEEFLGSVPDRPVFPWSWSADGKTLLLVEIAGGAGRNFDIGALTLEGEGKRKPLLQEEYMEIQPKISPDGRWMAYMSGESGDYEIYVRPFPDVEGGGRWQISSNGGDSPLWSPDGKELFYRSGDSVMAVKVETDPTFKPGKPQILFGGTYVSLSISDAHTWDISLDGKRFLMMKAPEMLGETSTVEEPWQINIVLNWFEELKKRAPGE